jgi:ergothioneine biosynthesis protein EgtB
MDTKVKQLLGREQLKLAYSRVREFSELLCKPLKQDDFQIQSIPQTSPPKWHIAHVSWFFETFILTEYQANYQTFCDKYDFLFNSYYYTHGNMHPRPKRGLLSRPTVDEIFQYRLFVDEKIHNLIDSVDESKWEEMAVRIVLGLHHEQQHQELLLMDVKHNFNCNPLKPAYREDLITLKGNQQALNWIKIDGGIKSIGNHGDGFCFDNETPNHEVLLKPFKLATRFITNSEYLEFIKDGGYSNPALWLSDGWANIQTHGWKHPLYWSIDDNTRQQFTLGGDRELNMDEPVCHISYYEADAFARWSGNRLPLESEFETMLLSKPITGNFIEDDLLHPAPTTEENQWYGNLWAWTSSPYTAYPGFKPLSGTMGEYNGKFMSNQMVLRGGSCVTSVDHVRPSYRNFFYPDERWAFTGLRLAADLE